MISKFDFYFCQLVAWTLHPGYARVGTPKPTLNDLADQAEELVRISEEKQQWPQSLPE